MVEIISRREFNKSLFGTVLKLWLVAVGCSTKEPQRTKEIPEIVIPNDGTVVKVELDGRLTFEVGIKSLIIASLPDVTYLYHEFAQNALPIPLAERIANPNLVSPNGFVPFDPSFDLEKALGYVQSKPLGEPKTIDSVSPIARSLQLYAENAGYLNFAQTPPIGSDQMFVYSPNLTYLQKADGLHLSLPSIVLVRFKFVEGKFSGRDQI